MGGDLKSRRWDRRIVSLMSEHLGSKNERGKYGRGERSGYIRCYGVYALATLFRTVPVDEWYNQRSRGTPVLDERGRGRETRPPTIPLIHTWCWNREKSLSPPRRVFYFESVLFLDCPRRSYFSPQNFILSMKWYNSHDSEKLGN